MITRVTRVALQFCNPFEFEQHFFIWHIFPINVGTLINIRFILQSFSIPLLFHHSFISLFNNPFIKLRELVKLINIYISLFVSLSIVRVIFVVFRLYLIIINDFRIYFFWSSVCLGNMYSRDLLPVACISYAWVKRPAKLAHFMTFIAELNAEWGN